MQERPPPREIAAADSAAFDAVKDGAFAERDGAIVIRVGPQFEALSLSEPVAARVRGMLAVRDAVRLVFRTQLDDEPEDRIVAARRSLNRIYDSFVWRHGPLSSKENVKAFAGDPDHPLLLSLETYDPETKRAAKTAVFEHRTLERYRPVEHAETAAEALAVSLNETGAINWPRMEQMTGRTPSCSSANSELSSTATRKEASGKPPTAI
jgi:N12 class adenine-specific DNA methylase